MKDWLVAELHLVFVVRCPLDHFCLELLVFVYCVKLPETEQQIFHDYFPRDAVHQQLIEILSDLQEPGVVFQFAAIKKTFGSVKLECVQLDIFVWGGVSDGANEGLTAAGFAG